MIQHSPIYHKTISASFQKLQKVASEGKFRVKSFRVKTTNNDLEQHLTNKLGLPKIYSNQSRNQKISSSILSKLQPSTNFDIDMVKSRAKSFKVIQKNYEQELNQMGLPTTFLVRLFEIKSQQAQTKPSQQRYQVFIKSLYLRIKNKKSLSISQMAMGPKTLLFFFKWFIQWNGHISELDLSYPSQYLKQHKIDVITKILQQDSKIQGLSLCNSALSGEQLKNILKSVSQKEQILKLDLSNNNSQSLNRFGDQIAILQDFTKNNQSVSTLRLDNLQLRKQGFQFICKGASSTKTTPLKSLSLSNNYISGLKLSENFYSLLRSGLTHLDISCNPLGPDFYKTLPNLRSTTIKQLDLRQTDMNSQCLYDFFQKIEESKFLMTLHLDGNDFSHHWFAKIAERLSTNTSLEWISMNNCKIKTLMPIFEGLQLNKYLKRLDANQNCVDSETELLNKIVNCFTANKNLEEFRVKFCSLNQQILVKIFQGLTKNKKLRILDISQNILEDNGAHAILRMLDENSKIQYIGVDKLQISYQMRKMIELKLKENKSIRDKIQFTNLKQISSDLKSKDSYSELDLQNYQKQQKTLARTLKKLEEKVNKLTTTLTNKKQKLIELHKKCKEEQMEMQKQTKQKIRFQNERVSLFNSENRKLQQIELRCLKQKEEETNKIRLLQQKIRLQNEHIKKRQNQLEDSLRDHLYSVKKNKKPC